MVEHDTPSQGSSGPCLSMTRYWVSNPLGKNSVVEKTEIFRSSFKSETSQDIGSLLVFDVSKVSVAQCKTTSMMRNKEIKVTEE